MARRRNVGAAAGSKGSLKFPPPSGTWGALQAPQSERDSRGEDLLVAKTKYFAVSQTREVVIPGYLIIEPLKSVSTICELPSGAQRELAALQSCCVKAISNLIKPKRVYLATFSEETAIFHCHVFPRTVSATERYFKELPARSPQISGPLFFDWARDRYRGKAADDPDVREAVRRLREHLAFTTE